MEAAERDAMLTLNLVPGLGPTLIRRCIEAFGSAQAALEASIRGLTSVKGISERVARNVKRSIEEFQADQSSIDRERQLIEKHGVTLIRLGEPNYPTLLQHIPDPPPMLYVRGEIREEDALAIAVVGSRRCSQYGREQADRLSGLCAQAGLAIVSGGAKVSTKLALLQSVVRHASVVCIGGAMANTFLLAQGTPVGASLAEPDMADQATAIAAEAKRRGCALLLPVDAVIAESPDADPRARPVDLSEETIPDGWSIFDVGPRTIEHFAAALQDMNTVVWNGPVGLFETEAFAGGTRAIAEVIAGLAARTIVAGGETVQAAREAGVADRISHISTGGGAALELLDGRDLPGLAALPDLAAPPNQRPEIFPGQG